MKPTTSVHARVSMSTDGFTLIEMLVALGMLAIITLASTGALPSLNRVNQASTQDQRALLLNRSAFEQARQQLEVDFDRTTVGVTLTGNNEGGVTCYNPELAVLRTAKVDSSGTQKPVLTRVSMRCDLGSQRRDFSVDIARPM